MRYQIFLSDFDGTLVRDDGTISTRNIEAIAKYRAAGGIFAVCTGRMLSSIRKRLHELGLDDGLVVAFQGAQIADIATGKLLKDDAFSREEALEVVRFMEESGLHVHIYAGEEMYANRRNALLEAYEQICRVKAIVGDIPLTERIVRDDLRVVKALAMADPSEIGAVRDLLRAKFGDKYFITFSSEWLVEIMPKNQTKGAAVRFLADYYGVPVQNIAAIGDQENDIPMLEAAGGKFAVGNAVERMKRVGTVVPTCAEDGVAYAIEHYAMKE